MFKYKIIWLQRTVHRNVFLYWEPKRCSTSQIYLIMYSTCFGKVHCPSSGVRVSQHCMHAIGTRISHASMTNTSTYCVYWIGFHYKNKIMLNLFVLNCVYICCIYGDTIRADVMMLLFLLFSLYHMFLNQWFLTGNNSLCSTYVSFYKTLITVRFHFLIVTCNAPNMQDGILIN
jgi:hypothetical protein